MAEEKKTEQKNNDDVIAAKVGRWSLLVLTALLSFFCWALWLSQKNESDLMAYAMRTQPGYKTFHNRIADYVRLDSLEATAIQAEGDFQKTTHFAMSEEYRYKDRDWDNGQNTQEYYRVTLYNLSSSVEEGTIFDLYQVLPDLKDRDPETDFKVSLFEVESSAYLKLTYNDGTLRQRVLKLTNEKSLEEVPVDSVMVPDDNTKEEQESLAPLSRYLTDAEKLGERSIDLDSPTFSIRIRDEGGKQRVIYQEESDLLELSEKGPYGIYFDAGKTFTAQEAEDFLNRFRSVGQTSYVDGLVMKPQEMATKDGQQHTITNFSDIEEWRYRDSELTMEAFIDREDVKAIINDPDSTLLPLGINPLDQSLVSYDMSKGTLYTMVDRNYSSINLNIGPYSENRPGFSKNGAYKIIASQTKDMYFYLSRIDQGGGDKQIIQFSDSYGTLFDDEEEVDEKIKDMQNENFEKVLEKGPANQIFPILKVETGYALQVLNQSVLSRGYLIQDFDSIKINETDYQIRNNQIINPLEVANSMVFVKDGKAITIKTPS